MARSPIAAPRSPAAAANPALGAVLFCDRRRSWELSIVGVRGAFFGEGTSRQADEPASSITCVTRACVSPHAALEEIRSIVDGHDLARGSIREIEQ